MRTHAFASALIISIVVIAASALCSCQTISLESSDLDLPGTASSPVPTPIAGIHLSPVMTPDVHASPRLTPTIGATQQPSGGSIVTGTLLQNRNAPVPAGRVLLYLGSVYFDTQGTPLAAGLDKQTAPRTQSDELGRFLFSNVPEGTYALILDRVYEAFLLNDPITGKDMLFKVVKGQSVDLGTLIYQILPGDGPLP